MSRSRSAPGRAPAIRWARSARAQQAESLATLVGCVAALLVLAHLALEWRTGQRIDQHAMDSVAGNRRAVRTLLDLLGFVSIATTAGVLAVCVALAVLRHRVDLAVGAATIVVGANLTTQVLKHRVFDRPDYGYLATNSPPSGHTTVVVSLVLAVLLTAPYAPRLLLSILGAAAVTLTAASTVVAGWHRPADILASLLVTLAWGALVALVLGLRRPGPRSRGSLINLTLSFIGAAVVGAFLVVVGVRPGTGWSGLLEAAGVLTALGVACTLTIGAFSRLSAMPDW